MKTKSLLAGLILLVSLTQKANADEIQNGKSIFLTRCAACHNINKQLTGPALAGVMDRRPLEWIINFVHSSQTLVKKGDTTAVALFSKFNNVVMPDHNDLTEDNIKSLLAYIKSETGTVTAAPFKKPGKELTPYTPLSFKNYMTIFGYLLVVAGLVAALYFAVVLKKFQVNSKLPSNQVV